MTEYEHDDDGNRIEGDGQTAIGDTPPPPEPTEFLGLSIGKTQVSVTDHNRILATEDAAQDSVEVTVTIRGRVTSSGAYRRKANNVERPVTIAVDSATVKIR